MSSDGVQKLLEYLQQTRRQAEISIDCLNSRVTELELQCEVRKAEVEKLKEERDYLLNLTENLKLENSKKWRLQERDDWKALVDSIQKDRDRLQDECLRLETALEQSQVYIEQQESALADVHQQLEDCLRSKSENESLVQTVQATLDNPPVNSECNGSHPTSPNRDQMSSPLLTSFGSHDNCDSQSMSPRPRRPFLVTDELTLLAEVKSLRSELVKAQAQRDVERRGAEAIRATQEEELQRLRESLGLSGLSTHCSSNSLNSDMKPVTGEALRTVGSKQMVPQSQRPTNHNVEPARRPESATNSDTNQGGLFSFFFYSNNNNNNMTSNSINKSSLVTHV